MHNIRLLDGLLCALTLCAGNVMADVSVRVMLFCDGAAELCSEGAYVALVAPDSVPRKPAAEAIASAGGAELVVPNGPYVLITHAPGYEMTFEPYAITEYHAKQITVHLHKNQVMTGTVTDTTGRPVPNAVVARAGLDAPATIRELSSLGTSAIRAVASTRTNNDGRWSVEVSNNNRVPLTVHAPGYATAWIFAEQRSGERDIEPVALQKASPLTVEVDRTDEDILVIPRPRTNSSTRGDWLDRAYAKTAASAALQWTSLPAGAYDVWAVNTNPRKFQKPVRLTSVQLAASGEETRVKVALPRAVPAKTAYLKLLLPRSADPGSLKAWAEATADNAPLEIAFADEDAMGGRVVYLDTAAAPERTYLTTARELLLPRSGGRIGESLRVQPLPRGTLSFQLTAPSGTKLPAFVRGTFSQCQHDEPRRALSFGVSRNGGVDMAAPAGCRTAMIEAGDFAPLAAAFNMKPAETRSLGAFRLSRSAGAEVHVFRQPSGEPATDVLVRALVRRGSEFVPLRPVKTDDSGVAQLAALPPEEDLVIEAYEEGSELKGSTVVRLEPAESAIVDRLEIPEAASLSVTASLDDEFVRSFPSSSLFALRLIRMQKETDRPPDTRDLRLQSNKSTVEFSHLAPGEWSIQLLVEIDKSLQTIDTEPVELASGERADVRRTAKPVVIEGVVRLRQQGIEALVEVRDFPPGATTIARPFPSQGDGSFRMVLPREGTYDIDVRRKIPDAPRIVLGQRELHGGRRLELSLPANAVIVTTLTGGEPAPDTQVTLKRRSYGGDGSVSQLTMHGRTNQQGEAIFDSVLDGPWIVEAWVNAEEPVTQGNVTVDPLSGITDITLHLDEAARLEGYIFAAGGGVVRSGAVDCVYVAADMVVRSARSPIRRDGSYSMKFAKPVPENLSCGVSTADGAILPFRAKPGTQFDLFMPQETGALTISDFGKTIVADRFWLVGDDQLFDLTWVARATGSRWMPLFLARVPAGRWRLVRAPSPDLLAVVQSWQGIDVVSELQIAPGTRHETNILPSHAP
jgi:5-hydroxyisourate hydrolase-like protein (transthyretin family)